MTIVVGRALRCGNVGSASVNNGMMRHGAVE